MTKTLICALLIFQTQGFASDSPCLNSEFQESLVHRLMCKRGDTESCELNTMSEKMSSWKWGSVAVAVMGIAGTKIGKAARLDRKYFSSTQERSIAFAGNKVIQALGHAEQEFIYAMKRGDLTLAGRFRAAISAGIIKLNKILSEEPEISGNKKNAAKIKEAAVQERKIIVARAIDQNMTDLDKNFPQEPKIREQLRSIQKEYAQKLGVDVKELKLSGNKLRIARMQRGFINKAGYTSAILGAAAIIGVSVGGPWIMAKRSEKSGMDLTFGQAFTLSQYMSINSDGELQVIGQNLAQLFSNMETSQKIFEENPKFCEALQKINMDLKEELKQKMLGSLQCEPDHISWVVETSRGPRTYYFEKVENFFRLHNTEDKYSIELNDDANGTPKWNGFKPDAGFIQTFDVMPAKLAATYTANFKACHEKNLHPDNIVRCNVGEDVYLNSNLSQQAIYQCLEQKPI